MELTAERDMIDITRLIKPDPDYHPFCCCGLVLDEAEARRHRVHVEIEDETDYPNQAWTECGHCRAVVAWPMVAVTEREFMPGLTRYFADGERISEDRFNELHKELSQV